MDQTKPIRQVSARRALTSSATEPRSASWMPVIETAAGIGLVVGIGLIMPAESWGLLNVNPHPLWIIAAAIAARYGGRAGYLAGALTALTYCALALVWVGGALSLLDAQTFVQPLLMLITGAALGELTDARERRLASVEGRARELNTALERLWERYRAVNKVNDALNERIAFGADDVHPTGPRR